MHHRVKYLASRLWDWNTLCLTQISVSPTRTPVACIRRPWRKEAVTWARSASRAGVFLLRGSLVTFNRTGRYRHPIAMSFCPYFQGVTFFLFSAECGRKHKWPFLRQSLFVQQNCFPTYTKYRFGFCARFPNTFHTPLCFEAIEGALEWNQSPVFFVSYCFNVPGRTK